MSQAKIIINVSEETHSHSNGLSGTFVVLGKKAGEDCAMLVVMPTPEIQDIGDQRKTVHWPKPSLIARDVVGLTSDAAAHTAGSTGSKEKWGLLLCESEPDVPKELLAAYEEEIAFLNDNPPDHKTRQDKATGARVMVNVEPVEVTEKKIALSARVQELKQKFEKECRKLVQKSEIQKAKENLAREDARLVAEGDTIWAGPEAGRANINEIHKRACRRLGQERPWCYVPQSLWACPGCGTMIKENVITCGHCGAIFDEDPALYAKMTPKQKAMSLYPERYAESVPVGGQGKAKQS